MPTLDQIKNLPQLLTANPMNLATTKSGQKCLTWCCLGCVGVILLVIISIFAGIQTQHRVRESPSQTHSETGGGPSFMDDCINTNIDDLELKSIINRINENQRKYGIIDVYKDAAQKTDTPWELLAAVHYREANNRPDGRLRDGNPLGGQTLLQSAIEASNELRQKAQQVGKNLSALTTDKNAIGEALFGYNGRAEAYIEQAKTKGFSHDYEGSPYVMNKLDPAHTGLRIIRVDHGPLGGPDQRYGAYPIFLALKKISGSCSPK